MIPAGPITIPSGSLCSTSLSGISQILIQITVALLVSIKRLRDGGRLKGWGCAQRGNMVYLKAGYFSRIQENKNDPF